MPVSELSVPADSADLPPAVVELLHEARSRIDAFVEARIDRPLPGFVPSDFEAVYRVLRSIRSSWLAPGDAFLEWGSGFGVVAMLAAEVGFSAHGIEIESDLVREARRLAAARGLGVEFVAGSFLPEGAEDLVPPASEFCWLETDGPSAYEGLGLEVDDFDVIFAYPWPGEEGVVVQLFERYAARGSLLVTYRGVEGVHVHRKVRRRR